MVSWLGDVAAVWFWPVAIAALVASLAVESAVPARAAGFPAARWLDHLGLYAGCLALAALLDPRNAVIALLHAPDGTVFARLDRLGGEPAVLIVGLLALDLFVYAMHWLQHAWFPLWRLHAVHHADIEMDATTALRHHPLAYLQIAVCVAIVFALLGLPAWVFPIYGVILFIAALFQHINLAIPPALDRALGWILTTPGMHRVHHSTRESHYNRNFGNVLSIWDRMFGTLIVPDAAEQERITYGLGSVQSGGMVRLVATAVPDAPLAPCWARTDHRGRETLMKRCNMLGVASLAIPLGAMALGLAAPGAQAAYLQVNGACVASVAPACAPDLQTVPGASQLNFNKNITLARW